MPAAPNIETLYNFEDQIEGAWKNAIETKLQELGLPAFVHTSRQRDVEATPRIELYAALTQEGDQKTTIGQAQPKQVPSAYEGTLTVKVVTSREHNDELHGPLRGIVRYLMSGANNVLNSTRLPYLQMVENFFSGSQPEVFAERNQDYTTMTYAFKFSINPDSWPSTS